MAVGPQQQQQQQGIVLTELEQRIFDRLLNVVDCYAPGTQLRVAGGWVRDKLLGKDSNDIDIVLDNDMTGQDFCRKVNQYLEWIGEDKKGVRVSKCNPEKSKHLETATMDMFDIQIDFVHLRSEKYSENSRIPTVEFGTATQDALRRDLTINSLFYNISTKSVEDLTKRGREDLKNGVIATPLPAKATFMDDPLRVLRAIRFGIEDVWTMELLLNGKDVTRVLGIPDSPLVEEWKQRVLKWQLAHPGGTKEECEDWMKRSH